MNKDFEKLCNEVLEEGFLDRIRASFDARKEALSRPEYKAIKARTAANSIISKFKNRIFKVNEKYSKVLHDDRARFFKAADEIVQDTAKDLKRLLKEYEGVKIRDHDVEKIADDFRQTMYNFYNDYFNSFKSAFESLFDNIDKFNIESTYVNVKDTEEDTAEDEDEIIEPEEDNDDEDEEETDEDEEETSTSPISSITVPPKASSIKSPISKPEPSTIKPVVPAKSPDSGIKTSTAKLRKYSPKPIRVSSTTKTPPKK